MDPNHPKTELHDYRSLSMWDMFDGRTYAVAGLDEQLIEIFRNVFLPYQIPEDLQTSTNVRHVRGIILYGDPGTGKTTVARAIYKLFCDTEDGGKPPPIVSAASIFSQHLGGSETNVKNLFAPARAYLERVRNKQESAKRIFPIIIDEIDALCRTRIDNSGGGDGVEAANKVLSVFLEELDGVVKNNNVFVIGMTNRLEAIDPALLRPGRLSQIVRIPRPTLQGRYEIFQMNLKHLEAHGHTELTQGALWNLAHCTTNFTGADIEEVVRETVIRVLHNHLREICKAIEEHPSDIERYRLARRHAATSATEMTSALAAVTPPPPATTSAITPTASRLAEQQACVLRLGTCLARRHKTPASVLRGTLYYESGSKQHPQKIGLPWRFPIGIMQKAGGLAETRVSEDARNRAFQSEFRLWSCDIPQLQEHDTLYRDLVERYIINPEAFVGVETTCSHLQAEKNQQKHRFAFIKVRHDDLLEGVRRLQRQKHIFSGTDYAWLRPLCDRHEAAWCTLEGSLEDSVRGRHYRPFMSIAIQGVVQSGRTCATRSCLARASKPLSPLLVLDMSEAIAEGRDDAYCVQHLRHLIAEIDHCKAPAGILVDGYELAQPQFFPKFRAMIEECVKGNRYQHKTVELYHPVVFVVVGTEASNQSLCADIRVTMDLRLQSTEEIAQAARQLSPQPCAVQTLFGRTDDPKMPACENLAGMLDGIGVVGDLLRNTAKLGEWARNLAEGEEEEEEEEEEDTLPDVALHL